MKAKYIIISYRKDIAPISIAKGKGMFLGLISGRKSI